MASEDDQTAGTAKKATGQRQPAKRSASKKTAKSTATAKKSTAKKSTAKKSAPAKNAETRSGQSSSGRASAPQAASRPQLGASDIARSAVAEVAGMTGHDIESITSLERTEEGWTVQVQAVELRRVPSTTDVLATYEVVVDSRGELQGYRRVGRYSRGDTRSEQ